MKKQITYTEPEKQFDQDGNPLPDVPIKLTVIATSEEEMEAINASVSDPARGITDISEWEDAPLTAEELIEQMDKLDKKLIRPLAAKSDGSATDEDKAQFASQMQQMRELREKLQALKA